MRSKTPGAAWGSKPSTVSNARRACAALAAKRASAKGLMSLAAKAAGRRHGRCFWKEERLSFLRSVGV